MTQDMYDFDLTLTDSYRCYTLAMERDIKMEIKQGNGKVKTGYITFFHLLFEYAPDHKNDQIEEAETRIESPQCMQ